MSDKEDLVKALGNSYGVIPEGTRDVIKMLSHPDVVKKAISYFQDQDKTLRCLLYEAPWSCRHEAEARYENIKFGWAGGASGIGLDESWCDHCRKRVLST